MAKGGSKKGGRRSRRHEDSDSDDDDRSNQQQEDTSRSRNNKDLDFAERRELQRKAAADKRRAKMKCHLCGKAGHVRRECPGILDDGRGESRHRNAKGDKNSRSKASVKGAKNRGRKSSKYEESSKELELPPGFEAWSAADADDEKHSSDQNVDTKESAGADGDTATSNSSKSFKYIDASCDGTATIEYLRSGRGKNKLSMKEAVLEYQNAIDKAVSTSNYGGCIARSTIKSLDRTWNSDDAFPIQAENIWYVLGFDKAAATLFDADVLCSAISSNSNRVVGVFADLDYNPKTTDCKGVSIDDQLSQLRKTIDVAAKFACPIQIRTAPSPPNPKPADDDDSKEEVLDVESPYSCLIVDLGRVLLDAVRMYPSLRVHLSCWPGKADHLNALLSAFPDNVWIGLDATVTFAKAVTVHDCAFELPLSKLVLETGSPKMIPSVVTKAHGRAAFGHSGHLPFVADAIAAQKKIDGLTAEIVARAASENTADLYFKMKR